MQLGVDVLDMRLSTIKRIKMNTLFKNVYLNEHSCFLNECFPLSSFITNGNVSYLSDFSKSSNCYSSAASTMDGVQEIY